MYFTKLEARNPTELESTKRLTICAFQNGAQFVQIYQHKTLKIVWKLCRFLKQFTVKLSS